MEKREELKDKLDALSCKLLNLISNASDWGIINCSNYEVPDLNDKIKDLDELHFCTGFFGDELEKLIKSYIDLTGSLLFYSTKKDFQKKNTL